MISDPDDRERLRHCPLPSGDEENGFTFADPTWQHPGVVMDAADRDDWLAAQASWVPRIVGWLTQPLGADGVAARAYVLALALGVPTGHGSLGEIARACGVSRETTSEYARLISEEFGLFVPGRRNATNAARCRAVRVARLAKT